MKIKLSKLFIFQLILCLCLFKISSCSFENQTNSSQQNKHTNKKNDHSSSAQQQDSDKSKFNNTDTDKPNDQLTADKSMIGHSQPDADQLNPPTHTSEKTHQPSSSQSLQHSQPKTPNSIINIFNQDPSLAKFAESCSFIYDTLTLIYYFHVSSSSFNDSFSIDHAKLILEDFYQSFPASNIALTKQQYSDFIDDYSSKIHKELPNKNCQSLKDFLDQSQLILKENHQALKQLIDELVDQSDQLSLKNLQHLSDQSKPSISDTALTWIDNLPSDLDDHKQARAKYILDTALTIFNRLDYFESSAISYQSQLITSIKNSIDFDLDIDKSKFYLVNAYQKLIVTSVKNFNDFRTGIAFNFSTSISPFNTYIEDTSALDHYSFTIDIDFNRSPLNNHQLILEHIPQRLLKLGIIKPGDQFLSYREVPSNFQSKLDYQPPPWIDLNILPLKQVKNLFTGAYGSLVQLMIQPFTPDETNKSSPIQITLVRKKYSSHHQKIKYHKFDVKTSLGPSLKVGVGWIQVPSFETLTGNESFTNSSQPYLQIASALGFLIQKDVKVVVLDLRSNFSQDYIQSALIESLFLTKDSPGYIVYGTDKEDFSPPSKEVSLAHPSKFGYYQRFNFDDLPLVILTNKRTRLAAELLAHSLQAQSRAIIIGDDQTYGNSAFQRQFFATNIPTNINSANMVITTKLLFDAHGNSFQNSGVKSDIVIPSVYSVEYPLEKDITLPNFKKRLLSSFVDHFPVEIADDFLLGFTDQNLITIVNELSQDRQHTNNDLVEISQITDFISKGFEEKKSSRFSFNKLLNMPFDQIDIDQFRPGNSLNKSPISHDQFSKIFAQLHQTQSELRMTHEDFAKEPHDIENNQFASKIIAQDPTLFEALNIAADYYFLCRADDTILNQSFDPDLVKRLGLDQYLHSQLDNNKGCYRFFQQ